MNRRAFLRRLVQATAAIAVAPTIVEAWACAPTPAPLTMSVRYIRSFEPGVGFVTRIDCLYGFGVLQPAQVCRIAA
jgi:hypothetical protein